MSRGYQLALLFLVPIVVLAATTGVRYTRMTRLAVPEYVLKVVFPPADQPRDLPDVMGDQDSSRPLVVIDPGHGGYDPGAGLGEVKEKTIALEIAKELRDKLLASGIRVAMTREDDRFVTLSERPQIARALGADLFVSIHADSADAEGAHGASVYVLSEKGSSQAAAQFAARENRADTVNGVSLSQTSDAVGAILLDLSQREVSASSVAVGDLILRELRGKVPLHYEVVESAALAVLKAPDIPSVLFETGFISNETDALMLSSEEGRATISDAATQAIRVFFARKAAANP